MSGESVTALAAAVLLLAYLACALLMPERF